MVLFQLENGMISRSSGIRPSGNSRKLNGHLVILVTGVTGRFLPRLMLEIDSTLMLWDVPETDMKQSTVDCGNGGLWMVHTDMIGGSIILCFELSLSLNRSSLRMVRRLSKCSTTSIQLFSKNPYYSGALSSCWRPLLLAVTHSRVFRGWLKFQHPNVRRQHLTSHCQLQ